MRIKLTLIESFFINSSERYCELHIFKWRKKEDPEKGTIVLQEGHLITWRVFLVKFEWEDETWLDSLYIDGSIGGYWEVVDDVVERGVLFKSFRWVGQGKDDWKQHSVQHRKIQLGKELFVLHSTHLIPARVGEFVVGEVKGKPNPRLLVTLLLLLMRVLLFPFIFLLRLGGLLVVLYLGRLLGLLTVYEALFLGEIEVAVFGVLFDILLMWDRWVRIFCFNIGLLSSNVYSIPFFLK